MITHRSPGTHNPGNPSLHVRIPPDPRHARTVRDALMAFSSLHGIDERDLEALIFAVGEALANAIEHGAPETDIEVTVEIEQAAIYARVIDRGNGLLAFPDRIAPLPDGLTERGRGIPIMQRCVDRVEVTSTPGEGTAVSLMRYRRTPPHQEARAIS